MIKRILLAFIFGVVFLFNKEQGVLHHIRETLIKVNLKVIPLECEFNNSFAH